MSRADVDTNPPFTYRCYHDDEHVYHKDAPNVVYETLGWDDVLYIMEHGRLPDWVRGCKGIKQENDNGK
jgi:hypothetical protein